MAHYAFLDENNIVTEVIVGVDETETIEGKEPEIWYTEFRGMKCKRTSYNTKSGQHILDGIPFRGNYAGMGYEYREDLDVFIPPKPFNSWVLNENTFTWEAPISHPNDDNLYQWNEETLSWDLVN